MRRLVDARRRTAEDGAAAVMVAILLLVLFGFTALALDVGAMYWERRQLQNGADAGALAVAQDLAQDIADGVFAAAEGELGGTHDATAKYYADANAADGFADVESVTLGAVDDPDGNAVPLSNAGEVTVTTLVNDDGENELRHWFARVLGFDGTRITATASAMYGPVVQIAEGFPVAICEDLYEGKDEFVEVEIKVGPGGQAEDVETDCQLSENWDGPSPGNFNWLETDGNSCNAELTVGEDIEGDSNPGGNLPQECGDDEEAIRQAINAAVAENDPGAYQAERTRYLVIFDSISKAGKALYSIKGLAAFEFTGINLRPGNQRAVISIPYYPPRGEPHGWHNQDCDRPQARCVQGIFRSKILTPGEVGEMFTIVPGGASDLLGVQLSQ